MLETKHPYIENLLVFMLVGAIAAIVIPPYNHATDTGLPIVRSLGLLLTVSFALMIGIRGISSASNIVGKSVLLIVLTTYILSLAGLVLQLWKGILG